MCEPGLGSSADKNSLVTVCMLPLCPCGTIRRTMPEAVSRLHRAEAVLLKVGGDRPALTARRMVPVWPALTQEPRRHTTAKLSSSKNLPKQSCSSDSGHGVRSPCCNIIAAATATAVCQATRKECVQLVTSSVYSWSPHLAKQLLDTGWLCTLPQHHSALGHPLLLSTKD